MDVLKDFYFQTVQYYNHQKRIAKAQKTIKALVFVLFLWNIESIFIYLHRVYRKRE